MKIVFNSLLIILLLPSCKNDSSTNIEQKPYSRHVGDIAHDVVLDEETFEICLGENNVMQYFNDSNALQYEGEKIALIEAFEQKYDATKAAKESGMLRVRFIVNCRGETGRFRLLGMDRSYQEMVFDSSITDQILSITQSLDGWIIKSGETMSRDYYQHLIFKIRNGIITEILP